MNEFFELLHGEYSAFGVFVIDVVAFFALVMVLRALVFLARYKISELVVYAKRGDSAPRYLRRSAPQHLKESSAPIQSRKGPVNTTRPAQNNAKPNRKVQ